MRIFTSILAATSLLGLTSAIPEPTPKKFDAWDSNGWTPAPTGIADGSLAGYKHPALFKRQTGNDNTVCGYLDGQADEALTCSAGRWCGFDIAHSWFGCCLSTTVVGTRTGPAGCPVITDCVDSASMSLCTGACALDTRVRKCTSSAKPYCGAFGFGDAPFINYICDSTPGLYELFLTPTGAAGVTGTFKTPKGGFTATGTVVGGGASGASGTGTFDLGSTKGNVQTLTDSAAATSSTTAPKTVTVVSTTGAATSRAMAAPVEVSGGLGVVGAAVMAVFGLF